MEKYLNKIKLIAEQKGIQIQPKYIEESVEDKMERILFEARSPANPPVEANDPTTKEGISNAVASEFFVRARNLATETHFAHLSTDSFSEHTALATFYEDIVEKIDSFCEAYIGLYGKFITLPPLSLQMKKAVDDIIEFREWVSKNRGLITEDSSMQNLIDETIELCNITIYKLQKLS
jgi:hypothetical protein